MLRLHSRKILLIGILSLFVVLTQSNTPAERISAQDLPADPPGATVNVKVEVPAGMQGAPFNVDRYLNIPPGFRIEVYARVGGARFMALTPDGHILVSNPGSGKLFLVRRNPTPGGAPLISDYVTGLRLPHDIVFATIGGTTYVYVSESHQINRYIYTPGVLTGQNRQVVVSGLPDATSPELNGSYGHQLKNIAIGPDNKLYVAIASTCNVCVSDATSNPVRSAIYQYDADGGNGRLFARGLRNTEGLAFIPGTNELWVTSVHRDNLPYPFNDGTGNYGKIITSYVDNHPPDVFTKVVDGGHYGWPYCNPNPDTASGMNNMPYDLDYDTNRNGSFNCGTITRISKGIQAHSTALGLSFLQGTNFPAEYRNGVTLALRGSWNRSQKTGYKVIYFPWNTATQTPGNQIDFVTGWLNDATQSAWGRVVDTLVDGQGSLFISDDTSGTIYRLFQAQPLAPTQSSPEGIVTTGDVHPTYRWNASAGSLYDVLVVYDVTTGAPVLKYYDAFATSSICNGSACSVRPTGGDKTLTNGHVYAWYVASYNATGSSPFSAGKAFLLSLPPAMPTQLAPEGAVNTVHPTYRWTTAADNTYHLLVVYDITGTPTLKYYEGFAQAGTCSGGTCSVTPTGGAKTLANGRYYVWYVASYNVGGGSGFTPGKIFNIASAVPAPTFQP